MSASNHGSLTGRVLKNQSYAPSTTAGTFISQCQPSLLTNLREWSLELPTEQELRQAGHPVAKACIPWAWQLRHQQEPIVGVGEHSMEPECALGAIRSILCRCGVVGGRVKEQVPTQSQWCLLGTVR